MTTTTENREVRVSDEQKTMILSTLATALQPVTNDEVLLAMAKTAEGKKISPYMVRRGLFELARDGIIGSRQETAVERGVRSKRGTVARGVHNMLYWANGTEVPERTVIEAMPGIRLQAGLSLQKRGLAKKRPATKKRPAKAVKMQTGIVVDERPAKEAAVQTGNRLDRLEARVIELEETLRRLVDALS